MQLTADCVATGVLWVCWHPDEWRPVRDGLEAREALPERSGGAPAAAAAAVTQQCVDLLAAEQSGIGSKHGKPCLNAVVGRLQQQQHQQQQ
jgi:hypothetical protein